MKTKEHINAHTAAVKLVQQRIKEGRMTAEEAQQFTDIVYMKVNSGQWPNDPQTLGLVEGEWKIATSTGQTTAQTVDLTVS